MEELYKDLQDRLKELESRKKSKITEGRIAELLLIIIRVQNIMLKSINKSV